MSIQMSKYSVAKIFYTPPGYTGTAELTASTGLTITDQGHWRFSQAGFNDGATFGLSLGWPNKTNTGEYDYGGANSFKTKPLSGGNLDLTATNWGIAVIGNMLTEYTDPDTQITYPASQCRIQIVGRWNVEREQNTNSYNSFGIFYTGATVTDLGSREMDPSLLYYLSPYATYTIQGANVTGGAIDTFSNHAFYCNVTETANSNNSNNEYQSNTITRPAWVYTYTKSWEIEV